MMLNGRLPQWSVWRRLACIVSALAGWCAAVVIFDVHSWNPQATVPGAITGWVLILAGTVLLLVSTLGIKSRWIPGWLAHLGRISFGLYVFHSLVLLLIFRYALPIVGLGHPGWALSIVGTASALLVTITAAHLSYRYFETFFLKRKRHFTYLTAMREPR